MSTLIMSACWPLQGMSPSQKSVLISLADNANDQGVCWPSIATIAMRTCYSERAVQAAIKGLCDAGLLTRHERPGRSTWYTITPAVASPRRSCTPADPAPPPPQILHPTPADPAPRTVNEPSVEPSSRDKRTKRARSTARDEVIAMMTESLPGLTAEAAGDYYDHRKRKRADLTARAWSAIRQVIIDSGWQPDDAITEAIASGWTGLDSEWLARKNFGGKYGSTNQGSGYSGGSRPSLIDQHHAAKAVRDRREAEAAARTAGQAVGAHGGDVRPPLDGESWRVAD